MNVSCVHACSSSYTRQQNERLVHARVQFPMVIRHRSVVRMRKMLREFLKTCRAVQLLHACVVKFKVSGTVLGPSIIIIHTVNTHIHTYDVRTYTASPGVVIITTPASPLPIELVATTENV